MLRLPRRCFAVNDNEEMARLLAPVLPPGSLSGRQQPVLAVDHRFVLRPWAKDDIPALVAAYADPDIQYWHFTSLSTAEAEDLILKWNDAWRSETGAHWAIANTSEDFAIGRISLRAWIEGGYAEVSYWVAPEFRGLGAASVALSTLSEWLLEDLGLHRLGLEHSIHNPASCRVASKAGYELEGTMKSALLHADGWHDMHLHARISQKGSVG